MAQLRQDYARFAAAQLKMIWISPNKPAEADNYRAENDTPYPIYTDYPRNAYARYGLGSLSTLHEINPLTWLGNLRKLGRVGAPKATEADMKQLGGVFIVDKGGRLLYAHIAEDAGDNPLTQEILAAVERISDTN